MGFLSDAVEDKGFTVAYQMDCLRQKFGVTDNLFWEYDFPTKDLGNITAKVFIAGPLHGSIKTVENGNFQHTLPRFDHFLNNLKRTREKKCIIYSFQICFRIRTIKL